MKNNNLYWKDDYCMKSCEYSLIVSYLKYLEILK